MRRYAGLLVLFLLAIAGLFLRDHKQAMPTPPSPPISSGQSQGQSQAQPQSQPQSQAKPKPQAKPAAASGDGYILALTWSPAFCVSEDPQGDTAQCRIGAAKGLLVHGLWPESRAGSSEYCNTSEPERLPDDLAKRVRGYMPDLGLARHEWKKHGSCSGLSQRDYFTTMERAYRAFNGPSVLDQVAYSRTISRAEVVKSITDANPGLGASAIALQCGRKGVLSEIRLCLDSTLSPVACAPNTGRGCPATVTILPPR